MKQDGQSKLITRYKVTSAKVHDSRATEDLPDKKKYGGRLFYADSAYTGEPQEKVIEGREMINRVCEKGYRNRPLTD